jgi:ABC-type multidrug transport system ATPase subunit
MEEAEVLCDRVVVMNSGRIVDRGTPADLIDRHSSGIRMRFPYADADLGWIERSPDVDTVTRTGSEVEVVGASRILAHVGAGLVERGDVPTNIRVHQPDLEDALLTLIGPNGATS